MKEQWRLLQTGFSTASKNMAIDRALLVTQSRGDVPPTLRLYGWSPAAISIGYFQRLTDEIDLAACTQQQVDYVRRITGGGAVFHKDEVTYSIVIAESHPAIPKNILKSYGRICGAVMRGLQHTGVESTYAPINDILVNGRKISGNAQTRKMGTVLQHGTILLDVDVDLMFSLLKVPNEKMKDKLISDVKQRVTSLKHLIGKKIEFDEVAQAMKKGFEDEFHVELVEETLSLEERRLAEEFEKNCFGTWEWNHQR